MKKSLMVLTVVCCAAFLASCAQGVPVDCNTKLRDVKVEKMDLGATFAVKCPAGCTTGTVWGTDTYTTDSSPCKAAIHAGVLKADKGGTVKIAIVKGLDKYSGSERNGVTTSDWNTSWGATAFTVSVK